MKVSADWEQVRILINREEKAVRIEIPKTLYYIKQTKQMSNISINISASKETLYELGKPINLSLFKIGDQPTLFFEMIDDRKPIPIWALGYK
jgi:hypothetical protein